MDGRFGAARFDALTDQFPAADKIVIANPLWNLNPPVGLHARGDSMSACPTTTDYAEGLAEARLVAGLARQGKTAKDLDGLFDHGETARSSPRW